MAGANPDELDPYPNDPPSPTGRVPPGTAVEIPRDDPAYDAPPAQQQAQAPRPGTGSAVGDLWIGRNRAVGQTRLTQRERQAFSPWDNRRIREAYDPMADTRYRGVYQDAGDLSRDAGRSRSTVEYMLGQTFDAPQYSAPNPYDPRGVTAATPGASTINSRSGFQDAQQSLTDLPGSRAAQQGVLGTAIDWAAGQGPSVGRDIANEAGVIANEQFLRAGSEANQAYGMSSAEANRAYQDALAQQIFATQQSAQNAARTTGDAASDAVLRQAALTSMARGGNIGMALRTGLQGAAAQSQQANIDAARIMGDANEQAAFLAAQGQRAAEQAQMQQMLATQGTQERAGFAAASAEEAARFRAAQIGSQEQQQALGLAAGITQDLRAGDLGAVGAAVDVGGLGLGIDQLTTNASMADADRSFAANQFNEQQNQQNAQYFAGLGLDYDTLNSQNTMNTNALNSQNWNAAAGRFQGDQQFGMGMQQQMTQFDVQMEQALAAAQMGSQQQLVQLLAGLDEASRERLIQDYGLRMGVLSAQDAAAGAQRGQWMQLGGAGLGAVATVGAGALGGWLGGSDTQDVQSGYGGGYGETGMPAANSYENATSGGDFGAQNLDPTYNPYGY